MDKRIKKFLGVLWERYYFDVKFLEDVTPKYRSVRVASYANWLDFGVGDTLALQMYRASDGLWYPV